MIPERPLQRLRVFYGSSILALRISALVNLILVATVCLLCYTLYQIRAQVHEWKPLVVRVDQVGNAVPVDLTVDNEPGTELEAKVFAAEYVTRIQSYDPNNVNHDMGLALGCTDPACARQLINYFNADPTFAKLKDQQHIVQCRVNAVQTIRANQADTSPWELRVDYTLTNLVTNEVRHWYALLTAKTTSRSFTNPFGLLVTGVRLSTTVQ